MLPTLSKAHSSHLLTKPLESQANLSFALPSLTAGATDKTPRNQNGSSNVLNLNGGTVTGSGYGGAASGNSNNDTGNSNIYAQGVLGAGLSISSERIAILKDLNFRHLKDNRLARCLEMDSAVRAMFSKKDGSNNNSGLSDQSFGCGARSKIPMTAGTGGSRREDMNLERAKEIAMTKIKFQRSRLFCTVYSSGELNYFLDRTMNYIDCFLKLLDIEEWQMKRTGESKFPRMGVFQTIDSTLEARHGKEKAMKELGMRYSLLLVTVAKERNAVVERSCFEAIYKLANVVARIYFPIKRRWEAIGEELDVLFRGIYFHHRPDNFDATMTWKSRAGPPMKSLSMFLSKINDNADGATGNRSSNRLNTLFSLARGKDDGMDKENIDLPLQPPGTHRAQVLTLGPEGTASASPNGGVQVVTTSVTKPKEQHVTISSGSIDNAESPSGDRNPGIFSVDNPLPLTEIAPHAAFDLPSATSQFAHRRVFLAEPAHIYKSLHARTLFTEQIVPSRLEVAKSLSMKEQKKALKLHRDRRTGEKR